MSHTNYRRMYGRPTVSNRTSSNSNYTSTISNSNVKNWCAHFKLMDALYKTSVSSPLHHDNRCKDC